MSYSLCSLQLPVSGSTLGRKLEAIFKPLMIQGSQEINEFVRTRPRTKAVGDRPSVRCIPHNPSWVLTVGCERIREVKTDVFCAATATGSYSHFRFTFPATLASRRDLAPTPHRLFCRCVENVRFFFSSLPERQVFLLLIHWLRIYEGHIFELRIKT